MDLSGSKFGMDYLYTSQSLDGIKACGAYFFVYLSGLEGAKPYC